MDKRWKLSKFAGLPTQFVSFAKCLDLRYDEKKKVLRDRDNEPVAWLLEKTERHVSILSGLPTLEVALWHPEGEAKMSWSDLKKIRTREDLLSFQREPLNHVEAASLSIEDVLEDAKTRAQSRAAQLANADSFPPLDATLKIHGTVGAEDMIRDVGGQKIFVDVFDNVGPIKGEDILPDAARPRVKPWKSV